MSARMHKGVLAAICSLILVQGANAGPPEVSQRPLPRPVLPRTHAEAQPVPVFFNARIRPVPRPVGVGGVLSGRVAPTELSQPKTPTALGGRTRDVAAIAAGVAPETPNAETEAATPAGTRRQIRRAARAQARSARRAARLARRGQRSGLPVQGSVCGDPSIRGETLARIAGRLPGCGIDAPVRVTDVDGVHLSQPSTMSCETASALKTWINEGIRPAIGRQGGGVTGLRVLTHYACRTRNNRPGARISEHGRGKALDIAAVNLSDGSSISVLEGWRDRRQARVLRRIHSAACGPFGTVLGPDADRYHRDHFHVDVARYRSGAYCR